MALLGGCAASKYFLRLFACWACGVRTAPTTHTGHTRYTAQHTSAAHSAWHMHAAPQANGRRATALNLISLHAMSRTPEPHSVSIKVMRLQCPTVPLAPLSKLMEGLVQMSTGDEDAARHAAPAGILLGDRMQIPTSFEALFVGETLRCFINLANTSPTAITRVTLAYASARPLVAVCVRPSSYYRLHPLGALSCCSLILSLTLSHSHCSCAPMHLRALRALTCCIHACTHRWTCTSSPSLAHIPSTSSPSPHSPSPHVQRLAGQRARGDAERHPHLGHGADRGREGPESRGCARLHRTLLVPHTTHTAIVPSASYTCHTHYTHHTHHTRPHTWFLS